MKISPIAGTRAPRAILVDVAKLISAYYTELPDYSVPEHRIAFGTSGHRGSSFDRSFNESHILAITQSICEYRRAQGITGPLFLGIDTHALSIPAVNTALEVLAANGVEVMIAEHDDYTPTPAVSHAILTYNRDRKSDLADGIVITPSHNPPDSGGFKYNPTNGGPADSKVTGAIEKRANELLASGGKEVKRVTLERALKAPTTHRYDYLNTYVTDLENVLELSAIRDAKIRMAVDPMGGAGVHYWPAIAERYKLDLTVVNEEVDQTFAFMTVDWDGKIRMDPSSSYTMVNLVSLKDKYDVAFGCDTDHDRHGIVSPSAGLLQPNHYLAVASLYLFQHRANWPAAAAIGKTIVSSQMIDFVAKKLGRALYEVPVGFKWFSGGLVTGQLGFVGEESAGASFLRHNGSVWTTDKDGLIPALLSAEILARTGRDAGELYQDLTNEFGNPEYERVEAPANLKQKAALSKLSPEQIKSSTLAGEPIEQIVTHASANNAAIDGIKVSSKSGWFVARPSGTEEIYKIYGESFKGHKHLAEILGEAQVIVDKAIAG